MSQNVEFVLSLEDKQFTASIDRAGKLLTRFGEQATKPAQKINNLERSLGSVSRIIGVLESKLDATADKLQDVAAGFELVSDVSRKTRDNITSLNSGLKTLIERVDTTTSSVNKLTTSLRKVQSELNEFSDWATFAGKSASRFGTEVKEASTSVSGMNTRLNTTTKRLSNWGVTTNQAAEGLKKVRDQMDAVIGRQQLISKPVRVRTSGYGEGGGNGGGGRHSGSYGHGGRGAENGVFSGLRGNIFLLGEIGDAARTVTDILFGWQKPIVEAASKMERMRVMLRGLNKDKANPGKAAAEDMQYIVDMAQNAPFAMQALTDSFVKFRSAGLDPTDGSLKALVDSVARFGGDSELLKRAAVAVQQMSGKGVVSMEELRQQLGEAVPNAMKAMADAAGITMGELTKAVSSGTVEAKQALSLMFVGLRAENENAAKDMMQTYTGALAQLQTSFTLFADRVGQTGYLDSLSKGMKELASILNSAEGISFANSLGSGLTTAIDGLRQLAQWLAKNQELVINLGKVVAAMVAFKLMRAGIMGVVGAGSQMVSTFATMATAIQTPFNLGATAVTRFNRAARMGLAPIPSLIFAIRGAITGLKGAFAGLTAFIAANPIGAAFTVATVAVAGLITYMTMLRSETSKVVDEIRKIPEAMTAAKRAQMADRAEKLEKQILADQRALKTGESVNYVSNSAGVITHKESKADIEARLKKNQEEYQKITGTIALGDGAVAKRLAKEAAESQIEKIRAENQIFAATFVKARQEALDKIQKINDDGSLSDDEKNKLLAPLRETVNKSYLEPAQKLVDSLSSRKNATEKQIANLNDQLEKAKKEGNTEQIQKLQGSIRGYQEHLEVVAQELTQAEFKRDNAAKSGNGLVSINGDVLGLGTTDKAAQKALAQYMRNQMDSATYQRTLPDGTPMMDFEGKPIIGPKQLKTQLNLQKASSASSLEKMSDEERAAAIAALTKAREQDAAAAEKAAQRSANASQRAAKKEQAAQQKLAAGYQKALDKADQLMGQMGESSKATVSFDQSLRDTTKSLAEETKARTDADSALASNITNLQAQTSKDIHAAITSEATARTSSDNALSGRVDTLKASVDGNTATIQQQATAIADTNKKVSTAWTLKMETSTSGGQKYVAGIALGIDTTGLSQFLVQADRFGLVNSVNGKITTPFVIDAGVAYMNGAYIKNGTIDNAKIGNFIQSNDYSSGMTGWHINKNGNSEFNNVTVRGTVYATNGKFTGEIQATSGTFRGTVQADHFVGDVANMYVGNDFSVRYSGTYTMTYTDSSSSALPKNIYVAINVYTGGVGPVAAQFTCNGVTKTATTGKGATYRDPDLNSTRSTGVGGTLYAAFNNVTSRTVAVTVKVTSSSQTHIYSPVMLISRGSGAFSMSGIS